MALSCGLPVLLKREVERRGRPFFPLSLSPKRKTLFMPGPSSWLSDVAVGALASGVNPASLALLNLAAFGAAAGFGLAVAVLPPERAAALAPHAGVAAVLALALAASVDWVLWHVGTAAPDAQRAQLAGWLKGEEEKECGAPSQLAPGGEQQQRESPPPLPGGGKGAAAVGARLPEAAD